MELNILDIINKIDLIKNPQIDYSLLNIMYDELSRKEVAHSKIIASILSPSENHKFENTPLVKFLDAIEIFDEEISNCIVGTEVNVNGRFIDILISWESKFSQKKAVIIENKLNGAIDQQNQLNDYYNGIKDHYDFVKIVYMPLNPNKTAKLTDASKEVLNKTIDFDASKLVVWLEECLKCYKKSSPEFFNLKLYKNLLEYMTYTNTNQVNAEKILKQLTKDELNKLITISSLVNSPDWNNAKYALIEEKIAAKFSSSTNTLQVHKHGSHAEFFFTDYLFWVELWAHETYFTLYLCSYSEEKSITLMCGTFVENSSQNNKFYLINTDKQSKYDYPSEEKRLVQDLEEILQELSKYNK